MEKYEEKDIKEIVLKLAHFNPSCEDEYGFQFLDYLVLDILATFGIIPSDTETIKTNIKSIYYLTYEYSEINNSGKRLKDKETIEYIEGSNFENSTFKILPETKKQIDDNLNEIKSLEEKIFGEWKEELKNKYSGYSEIIRNLDIFVESLKLFISILFKRHSISCVALIYPGDKKIIEWLKQIEGPIFKELPSYNSLLDVALRLEIIEFFNRENEHRIKYITSLFNSSFFLHLTQVDEKCSRLLKKVVKGQKLYIDNNILYSLVGLHGKHILEPVHSILEIAKKLGYELWITEKTIVEFHSSLRWQLKEFNKTTPLPRDLAKIAVEKLGTRNFITIYWKELIQNGTSIEEFISEKSHIEKILEGLVIRRTDELQDKIENSQELKQQIRILSSVSEVSNEHIVEHDAYHKVFIDLIREKPRFSFHDAVAWFLTQDNKLPLYDRASKKNKMVIPFCITTDQWVQINRPLLTRIEDQKNYDKVFSVLLTQPFLRTMISSLSMETVYREVLGRLSRYENMNQQLALEIITDQHFMLNIATEKKKKTIAEKVDGKVVDLAKQLNLKNIKMKEDLESNKDEITELQEKLDSTEIKYKKKDTLINWIIFSFIVFVVSCVFRHIRTAIPGISGQ